MKEIIVAMILCVKSKEKKEKPNHIKGTWELISATTIHGDSIFNKDLKDKKMINDSHFAFLNHDVKKEKDSLKYYIQEEVNTNYQAINMLSL